MQQVVNSLEHQYYESFKIYTFVLPRASSCGMVYINNNFELICIQLADSVGGKKLTKTANKIHKIVPIYPPV